MLQMVIGALLAIAGGIIGTWLRAKFARRAKMGEILAERRVNANEEAFKHVLDIRGHMWGGGTDAGVEEFEKHANWFLEKRLFLSGKLSGTLMGLRLNLSKAARLRKVLDKGFRGSSEEDGKIVEDLTETEIRANRLADEAVNELLKEMGLTEMTVELPDGSFKHVVIKRNPFKSLGQPILEFAHRKFNAIFGRGKH